MERSVARGDIFMCDFGEVDAKSGSLQRGKRPCVVISNNVGNARSNICIVVPLSTKLFKKYIPTHVLLNPDTSNKLKLASVALCEQTITVTKEQLSFYIGECTSTTMNQINNALMVSIGLSA